MKTPVGAASGAGACLRREKPHQHAPMAIARAIPLRRHAKRADPDNHVARNDIYSDQRFFLAQSQRHQHRNEALS